ncbi:MAG: hypothetical protein ACP5HK_06395 [Acidilobus sp.]
MKVRISKGLLAAVLVAIAASVLIPYTLATVVFVYNSQVTLQPTTPLVFLQGPDGPQVNLVISNKTNPQITMTIPITNSSETYVSQPIEFTVNAISYGSTGASQYTLYVVACSYSTPSLANEIELFIYPTTSTPPSSPTITLQFTSSGCSASGSITVSAGTTYYIDVAVVPALPIQHGASQATVTIYFGLYYPTSASTPTINSP